MTPGQVQSALKLVAPMSDMLELLEEIIHAHHPQLVDASDCPVCVHHAEQVQALLERWQAARAVAEEHWS